MHDVHAAADATVRERIRLDPGLPLKRRIVRRGRMDLPVDAGRPIQTTQRRTAFDHGLPEMALDRRPSAQADDASALDLPQPVHDRPEAILAVHPIGQLVQDDQRRPTAREQLLREPTHRRSEPVALSSISAAAKESTTRTLAASPSQTRPGRTEHRTEDGPDVAEDHPALFEPRRHDRHVAGERTQPRVPRSDPERSPQHGRQESTSHSRGRR